MKKTMTLIALLIAATIGAGVSRLISQKDVQNTEQSVEAEITETTETAETSTTETTETAETSTTETTATAETTKVKVETTEQTTASAAPVENVLHYRGHIYSSDGKLLRTTKGDTRFTALEDNGALSNVVYIIDNAFDDKLRQSNEQQFGEAIFALDATPLGQSLMCTINHEKQQYAFDFLTEKNINGCLLLLDDTGGILAAASTPSATDSAVFRAGSAAVQNKCFAKEAPGSTAKIMAGVVASECGIHSVHDTGHIDAYGGISNWDYDVASSQYPLERTTAEWVRASSNVAAATVYEQVGEQKVHSVLQKYFGFEQAETDFGILENTVSYPSAADFIRSAFGQRMQQTPLFSALICDCVTSGTMKQAHFAVGFLNTANPDLKNPKYTERKHLDEIPISVRQDTLDGMAAIAKDLNLSTQGKTVYAKTGTAEINDTTDYLTIVATYRDADGKNQTMLLCVENGSKLGFKWASDMKTLFAEAAEHLID